MLEETTIDSPSIVLPPNASTHTPPSVLTQEDVLKFAIGLRLLGEKKSQRFLAYIRSVQESSKNRQTSSKKEG